MKTLDDLRKALPAKNERAALEAVAQGAHVPYHTLLKVVNGATKSPRYDTVERLFAYLDKPKARRHKASA